MVSATDDLVCDVCKEGFCEIVDKPGKIPGATDDVQVDEEKKKANEEYRIVFGQGDQHRVRVDPYDRSTSNIYGEPSEARMRQCREEEEKKAQEARQRQ